MQAKFYLVCPKCGTSTFGYIKEVNIASCVCGCVSYVKDLEIKEDINV